MLSRASKQVFLAVGLVLLTACQTDRFPSEAALHAEALARFDPDGDGVMTAAEYASFAPQSDDFATIDANEDGTVDPREFGAWLAETPPRPEFGGRSTRALGPPPVHQSEP